MAHRDRIWKETKPVAWPSCAWQLLSFSPFPVGHPMSAGCIGCRRDSHNSAAWSSNFPRHLYVRVPVPSNACLFLEVGEMSAYMSDASLNANVCRKSRVRRRRRSLPFTTAPRPYIDRADFLMATNCLSYIFCPIPPLSLSV